jgi:hypothetical protein
MRSGLRIVTGMATSIILTDTFNGRELSRHRTIAAAVKAEKKHAAAWRRANGRDSYITYSITAADGQEIGDEIDRARLAAHGW